MLVERLTGNQKFWGSSPTLVNFLFTFFVFETLKLIIYHLQKCWGMWHLECRGNSNANCQLPVRICIEFVKQMHRLKGPVNSSHWSHFTDQVLEGWQDAITDHNLVENLEKAALVSIFARQFTCSVKQRFSPCISFRPFVLKSTIYWGVDNPPTTIVMPFPTSLSPHPA